jgi:Arc/MetJ-type ribon-helix-helix transcriptional regulator
MNADVGVVRLPAKDSALIDHFLKVGEFKSKSEFITYAVKKAVNEVILKELEEKSRAAPPMAEKDVDKLLTEIKDIRKKLWEGYAHRVF